MRRIQAGSDEFGRAFEHFLIEEVRAYQSYRERFLPLSYWRTSTGLEVDLIIGELDAAIEFKARGQIDERDTKGLRALLEDQKVKKAIVVSLDKSQKNTVPRDHGLSLAEVLRGIVGWGF